MKKAEEAIKEVSKADGYNYVLDSSVGVILFLEGGNDLAPAVKRKLGIPETATMPKPGALPKK